MMINKKGQGMSLNVIIIAILALVVLVILLVVFIGRIGVFETGVSKKGEAELLEMKATLYGQCKPTEIAEDNFRKNLGDASKATSEAEQQRLHQDARSNFQNEISRCKGLSDKARCDGQDCSW